MPDDDLPTSDEVLTFLADLRAITDRVARFEDVPADELAEFEARKRALIERIEPGHYERGGWTTGSWVPGSRRRWAYRPLPCPVCHCDEPHVHQVNDDGSLGLTYFTLAQLDMEAPS